MTLSAGTKLGHYEVRSQLGAGGMGEVYLAEDTRLHRKVALKLLPAALTTDKDRLRRFEQEAGAASALNHPNILTIYETGKTDSLRFIATEYIEGETLRQRISYSGMTITEALDVAIQVAAALSAAHKAGIVHRDVKPENIMMRRDGIVKVLDFGLAKLTGRQPATPVDTTLPTKALVNTEPGLILGTAYYMSPEQARGLEVDERTDIWSLGCVLYEMIAGCRPFTGATTADVVAAIVKVQPAPLSARAPEAPAKLAEIVTKTLEKDREERYQGINDLLVDLRRLRKRVEFEAEAGRSAASPEPISASPADNDSAPATNETGTKTSAPAKTAGTLPPASSPAYIVNGIQQHKLIVGLLALVAVIAAIVVVGVSSRRSNSGAAIESIAVLPFVNQNNDPNTEYLSDGIPESIIDSLSQLPRLKVMSRNSVFHYKGKDVDAQAVARDLKVQAVLTGRVTQRDDGLVISVELINAQDNSEIWGQQYNRKLADLFAVQEEIAKEISEKLRLKLTGAEKLQIAKRYTDNLKAFEYYTQGRSHLGLRTREELMTAINYYQKAIGQDSNYALAYAGIAEAYANLGGRGYLRPVEARRQAEEAAEKALELDGNLAEGHLARGEIAVLFAPFDFARMDSSLQRALELSPNLASIHHYLGNSYVLRSRHDEALREFLKARELDPLSPILARVVVGEYYFKRDYARALELLRQANDLRPSYVTFWEVEVYLQNQAFDEALAQLQIEKQLRKDDVILLESEGKIYAAQRRRAEALQVIKKLEEMSGPDLTQAQHIASIYALLGDNEQALAWLNRGVEAKSIFFFIKDEPLWDPLRSDPRFSSFLGRLGLQP